MLRILLSIGLVLLVLGGALTYMARRSMSLCPALSRHPRLVWGFFGLFLGAMFLVPLINRWANHQADYLYWLSYGLFSFVSTYLVYLAVADFGQVIAQRWTSAPVGLWAFRVALGATVLSVLVGLIMAVRQPQIKQVEVAIAGLPKGLEGFRIVQISDLHLGPLVPMAKVQLLVERTNELKADLIAITGDLVDGEANGVQAKAERMASLRASHGVFFVTGNHEYYSGIAKWIPIIKGLGWKTLDNGHELIERQQAQLAVLGMPDPAARGRRGNGQGPNLAKALEGIPEGTTKLLLFHPPTGFEAADKAGIALQLSGHTHSGQYFPWSLFIPWLYRFPKGLNRQGALWIYTSVGTGFWGPPNRFLVAPELTVLTLRRA
ncbi:MAG: metallophosphoesterase [Holophaga sp.]|nr:metallophosphoesterase [Holophaga sp.]